MKRLIPIIVTTMCLLLGYYFGTRNALIEVVEKQTLVLRDNKINEVLSIMDGMYADSLDIDSIIEKSIPKLLKIHLIQRAKERDRLRADLFAMLTAINFDALVFFRGHLCNDSVIPFVVGKLAVGKGIAAQSTAMAGVIIVSGRLAGRLACQRLIVEILIGKIVHLSLFITASVQALAVMARAAFVEPLLQHVLLRFNFTYRKEFGAALTAIARVVIGCRRYAACLMT
jgi:hypothetical protein